MMKKAIAYAGIVGSVTMGTTMITPMAAHATTPTTAVAIAGHTSATIRALQQSLIKLGYMSSGLDTGYYGSVTAAAVKSYEAKHNLPQTTSVTQALLNRIKADASKVKTPQPKIDSRCLTGARVACVDQSTHTMYYVTNGKIQKSFPVRTGRPGYATRNGSFHIYMKSANWMSTLYHVRMPYSMFFSGGEAIHYSADFNANGYGVGSHGCVNMKEISSASWLYSQMKVGDKVVVYA